MEEVGCAGDKLVMAAQADWDWNWLGLGMNVDMLAVTYPPL